MAKIGVWAFIAGIVVAIVAAFVGNPWTIPALVVVGIIVGLLNVSDKETTAFLTASVSVMIAVFTAGASINSSLATLGTVGTVLAALLQNINVLVFPATIVVAIKAIYALAKD